MVNPVAQALQPLQPFLWGRGGAKLTPEQIAREREIAEALGTVDMSPVDHWLQGAARMANAAVGRLRESRADRAEQENNAYARELIERALSGGVGGSTAMTPAPSGASPVAATAPAASSEPMDYASARVASAHGDPVAWRNAIASIESAGSGDYAAVGPTHPKLGRALGRYQVMEANVGPWTEKYLGRRLTPEEFLASPEAQDAVFDGVFGSYVQQFGDPALAAQAWFAGPGGVGTNRKDSLGTSVPEYAQKFTTALGRTPAQDAIQAQLESLPVGGSMTMPAPDQMATGSVQTALMPQQAPAPQTGGINPAIIEALSSPYANEGTRRVAALLLEQQMKTRQPQELINAGKGRIYDPNTGKWLTAPDMGTDAPTVQTFYGEDGREYKAQWDAQNREWVPVGGAKAPSGMVLRTNPDGSVEFSQGGVAGQTLTEMQGKDIGFYTRGMDADQRLSELDTTLTDWAQQNVDKLPLGIGNYLRTPEFRQAKQAADSFLTALLRKDTGAAITNQEFEIYGPMFLPVPGDDPATIEQKRRARQVALLAIRSGLGTAEAIAEANRIALGIEEKPLPQFPSVNPSQPQGAPSAGEVPAGVDPADWQYMTPEERALFQ